MLGIPQPIKTLYCIGDNVCTDIFGANLYNNYLQRRHHHQQQTSAVLATTGVRDLSSRSIDNLVGAVNELSGADVCYSVLVETGEIRKIMIDEVLTQLRRLLNSTNYLGGFLYPTTNPLNLKLPVFFLTIRGDEKGVCLMYDFVRVRGIRLLSYHLSISGVFKPDGAQYTSLEHSPRDFLPVEKSYQEPTLTTSNVLKAVQTIFRKENWPVG